MAGSRKRQSALTVLIITIWLTVGCEPAAVSPKPTAMSGETMGTTYSVQLFAERDDVDLRALESALHAALDAVNGRMSTYLDDSEVSRFNQTTSADWFAVSADTAAVLAEALRISALSDGAFDVTIGPVVNLWGFGPGGGAESVPAHEAILNTLKNTGFEALIVRLTPPSVRKMRAGLQIDLSAIAKGYAVDRLARVLDERQIGSYLVEIGGELRSRGYKPDGSPWQVAIEKPLPGTRRVQRIVKLADTAIATSGDYRNYFERDGMRYSHTIDPRSGYPVRHRLVSVSVIARTAMEADALATALHVLGPEEGFALAARERIAAFFIVRTPEGLAEMPTPQFQPYLLP